LKEELNCGLKGERLVVVTNSHFEVVYTTWIVYRTLYPQKTEC